MNVGDLVERTDVDGWGVGKVSAFTRAEARVYFPDQMGAAWVKREDLVSATPQEPRVFDKATVVEVELIIQSRIDKTRWASDAASLKLALADVRKLVTS